MIELGTKSVLCGAHCFFLHPFFVARAWYRLHGWRVVEDDYVTTSLRDWRLWLAFFVHDLGYIGKPNMDGEAGERHPYWGGGFMFNVTGSWGWANFVVYHSRFLATRASKRPSALCVADKLAIVLTPAWLYIPMTMLTGEIDEYMAIAARNDSKYTDMKVGTNSRREWYKGMQAYVAAWVQEHRGGGEDTWTARTYAH